MPWFHWFGALFSIMKMAWKGKTLLNEKCYAFTKPMRLPNFTQYHTLVPVYKTVKKKSHLREKPTLSTDVDSCTDTIKSNQIQTPPRFKGYLFDSANRLLPVWSCQSVAACLILPIGCYLADPANWLLPGWSCQSTAAWLILAIGYYLVDTAVWIDQWEAWK